MIVYILLFLFITIGGILQKNVMYTVDYQQKYSNLKTIRLVYCVVVGIFLYLLIAFRSINMGVSDTAGVYYQTFNNAQYYNWDSIIQLAKEQGSVFWIVTKLLTLVTKKNYQLYIALIGFPYIYSAMYTIYKFSDDRLVSIVTFVSMYYLYSMFLLRQMLAMAIILLSIKYIFRKNIVKFIIMVLIAALIHATSLIFLIAYPFSHYIKPGMKNYILIIVSYCTAKLFPTVVYTIMPDKLIRYTRYGIYDSTGSMSMFPLIIMIVILLFSSYSEVTRLYKGRILFNIVTVGAIVYPFVSVISDIYRFSLYFGLFNILLIPCSIINLSKSKSRSIVIVAYIVIFAILTLYFFTRTLVNMNAIPYEFFWLK